MPTKKISSTSTPTSSDRLAEEFHVSVLFKDGMSREERVSANRLLESPAFRRKLFAAVEGVVDACPELKKTIVQLSV